MNEPVFTVIQDARGTLVRCEHLGQIGAARVGSRGLDEAKQRAQAQAEAKAAAAS